MDKGVWCGWAEQQRNETVMEREARARGWMGGLRGGRELLLRACVGGGGGGARVCVPDATLKATTAAQHRPPRTAVY